MKGRQMRKKIRGTSKTCIEKSSIPSVDVHVVNDNIIFAAKYVFVVWNFTRLITMLKSF